MTLQKLDLLLREAPFKDEVMTSDQIHGLLCAIISSPKEPDQRAWLDAIYNQDEKLLAREETKAINEQIFSCLTELTQAFEKGNVPAPTVLDAGKAIAYQDMTNEQLSSWCAGYMAGVLLNQKDWMQSGHKEIFQLLTPIGSFATLYADELPKSQKKPNPKEVRAQYFAGLPDTLRDIYDFWRQHQHCGHHHEHQHQGTVKYDQPKVGRNDPCFCGSGKKYKKCCING